MPTEQFILLVLGALIIIAMAGKIRVLRERIEVIEKDLKRMNDDE